MKAQNEFPFSTLNPMAKHTNHSDEERDVKCEEMDGKSSRQRRIDKQSDEFGIEHMSE